MKKTIYSSDYETFRRMVREERERLKMSQEELGAKLKKHQPFVARIESGQRRLDVIEFIHLMQIMGVSPVLFLQRLMDRIGDEIES